MRRPKRSSSIQLLVAFLLAPAANGELLSTDPSFTFSDQHAVVQPLGISRELAFPPGVHSVNGLGYRDVDGTLWISAFDTDSIYQLDSSYGDVLASFPSPGTGPSDLTWDGASIWVTDFHLGVVSEIDPDTGAELSSCVPPGALGGGEGLAFDGANFFVGNDLDGMVYRMDRDCTLLEAFPSPGKSSGADGLGFDHSRGVLWLLGYDDYLYALDAVTHEQICAPEFVGGGFDGAAFDGAHVWVADNFGQRLLQLPFRCPVPSVVEVPAVGTTGLVALSVLLAIACIRHLRSPSRRPKAQFPMTCRLTPRSSGRPRSARPPLSS